MGTVEQRHDQRWPKPVPGERKKAAERDLSRRVGHEEHQQSSEHQAPQTFEHLRWTVTIDAPRGNQDVDDIVPLRTWKLVHILK